jgi:zinc protease
LNTHHVRAFKNRLIKLCTSAVALPVAVLIQTSSFAQSSIVTPLPANVQLVQTVEGVTEYKLTNGLRILLAPDSSNDRVTVNVTYMVGSRHEGYGETGMAHLLEHLIFKGSPTTRDPKAEFARRGFTFNGTTNVDRTNYFATFQSNQESLDWYLGWQADAMVNSFISRKDLDSEMTVVRNEYERGENNPVQALVARMSATAFMWHNYGKSTIGAKSDIENVDITKLQDFYKRYYRPDNAVVLVAGKFDTPATIAQAAKVMGPLIAPGVPVPQTYTLDEAQDGERSVVVRRPSASQTIINGYHTPAALHPDNLPLALLNLAMTTPPNGRLHKALVETSQAQAVFGSPLIYREAGFLLFGANLGANDDPVAQKAKLTELLEGVASQPITQEEFDRAKNLLDKSLDLILSNASFLAGAAIENAVHGDWRAVFAARPRLAKVTLEDVNRAAKLYLVASNRTAGHLVPTQNPVRSPSPQPPDATAYLQGIAFKTEGESSVEFDYSFANLQKNSKLSNVAPDIKIGVLSKPVRGDMVSVRMQLRFGNVASLNNRTAAAQMAANMLARGTPKYDQQQIQDALVKLGAAVNLNGGPQGAFGTIMVKKDQLPATLDLVTHLLKESNFPAKDFAEIKQTMIKNAEGQLQDKATQANFNFNRYGNPYAKGDPRYAHTSQEWLDEIRALTREQVVDFHKQFYGAQSTHVTVLGPVDVAAVKLQVTNLLQNWRAPQPWERVPYPLVVKATARLVYDTPDKTNASLRARLYLPLTDMDTEAWQLRLATRIFGGGPGSRLWTRLREKSGLSYSVGAALDASRYEKSSSWSIDADVAPANLATAEAAVREEIVASLSQGFSTQEFNRFKTQWLTERQRARSGDEHAITMIRAVQEFSQAWDLAVTNDAMINQFTLEQINAVWRKFIQTDAMVWGLFADSAKTK